MMAEDNDMIVAPLSGDCSAFEAALDKGEADSADIKEWLDDFGSFVSED